MNAADPVWRPLGQLLLEKGLITEAQLEEALADQRRSGLRLGEILVGRGWLSLAALTAVLAEQHGLELGVEESLRSRLSALGSERSRT